MDKGCSVACTPPYPVGGRRGGKDEERGMLCDLHPAGARQLMLQMFWMRNAVLLMYGRKIN